MERARSRLRGELLCSSADPCSERCCFAAPTQPCFEIEVRRREFQSVHLPLLLAAADFERPKPRTVSISDDFDALVWSECVKGKVELGVLKFDEIQQVCSCCVSTVVRSV